MTYEAPVVPIDVRMKEYESVETARRLDPSLPIYARIDGRGFSKFTKGMAKPFDPGMSSAMIETARILTKETGARIGYVQSDEISLVFSRTSVESTALFDAKVHKLLSVLSGQATAIFTQVFAALGPDYAAFLERRPHFDARVLNLPSREEAVNMLIWRQQDAVRNAVSSHAAVRFTPKQLHGRSQIQMGEMLSGVGIFHSDLPRIWREGAFVGRRLFELDVEPNGFRGSDDLIARPDGSRYVLRSRTEVLEAPRLQDMANREEFVFDAAEPVLREERVLEPAAPAF